MAAEVRDLAFTIKAIDSASATVDEIAAKLERASEGQARSVANAQRQIAAIIARGDPAKAQAVALEKELAQLKSYGDRAKASEETIAAARRKIIEDFERSRQAVSARTAESVVASTNSTKQALGELKGGIGDIGQLANSLAGNFDATGQKVTGLVQSMVASFSSGGPVALAIGGTIALLGIWKSELDEIKRYAAEAAKTAADAQQAYNAELDQTLNRLREEKAIRGEEAAGGSRRSLELGRTAKGAEELAASRADQIAGLDAQIAAQRQGLADFLASPDAEDSSVTGMNEAARQGRRRVVDDAVAQLEAQRAELQKQYDKEIEVAKLAGEAYQQEISELEQKRAKLAQEVTAAPGRGRRGGGMSKAAKQEPKKAEEKFVPGEYSLWTPYDQFEADRANARFKAEQEASEKAKQEAERVAADREKAMKQAAAERLRADQEMAKAAAEAMKAEQEAFREAGLLAAETFAQGFKAAMDGEDTRSIIKGVLQGVAGVASMIPGGQAVGIGAGLVSQFLRAGGPVLPQGRGGLATMVNNDGIPAVLHPNEFVFDSESVNAAGGIGRLEALRRDLRSGGGRGASPSSGAGAVVNVVAFDQGTMLDTIGKAVEPAQYRRVANRQGSKARDAARKAATKPRSGF